jgi:putative NADH-flavin reductase
MASHANSYRLPVPASSTNIAPFSANGQIGSRILNSLVSSKRKAFQVVTSIPPGVILYSSHSITTRRFDVEKATRAQLAKVLEGVDAVVSALDSAAAPKGPSNHLRRSFWCRRAALLPKLVQDTPYLP